MTKEELEKEAVRKSLSYNTKYSEDGDLKDMLSRPQDFIEGSIARMVDLLRKKAYRDGMVDGAEPREKQIQIDAEQIRALQKQNGELNDEVRKLKILVSSLVYEINQIWDINEMNDDLRRCAEKIDREVQLSKMAEDNRMVISALGFAIVPPKPKLYVKEV